MSDSTYPLYPVAAFLGFVLALVPLPWHLYAWNSGTCFFMIWTSIACLNQFVNSIIWHGNAFNSAPVWCDISTRIMIGYSVGIPASSLCISRRLYAVAKIRAVCITRAEKRRAVLIDSLICVLLPIIYMCLEYIVQGHRFNIFEDFGCYLAIYNTLPAYFLVYIWPISIGLVSAVYRVLSIRAFMIRRADFHKFLSGSGLTSNRYFRLMALAMADLVFNVPLGFYEIYTNATSGSLQPWRGWADTHFDFSKVDQYPAILWRNNPKLAIPLELSRWVLPLCAFTFFAFFGFAEEARRQYRAAFWALAKWMGFQQASAITSSKADSSGIMLVSTADSRITSSRLQSFKTLDVSVSTVDITEVDFLESEKSVGYDIA